MIFPYADENPAPGRDWEITALVVVNILAVVVWGLYPLLGFTPAHPVWYTWVTSLFLHADIFHLGGNMYALWLFGNKVAYKLGKGFLPFYLGGGLAANAAQLALNRGSEIPCVGASGAVCAAIAAYVVFFPSARMRCYAFIVYKFVQYNISALLFGVIYVASQFRGLGSDDGVAYGAHIGGLIFGFLFALAWPDRTGGETQSEKSLGAIRETETSRSILLHLKEGDDELAVQKYIKEIRSDPGLELPEESQYQFARKLLSVGYPQLAKTALERLIRRSPGGPRAFASALILGYIDQTSFKNFPGAREWYAQALVSPDEVIRKDAAARAASVDRVLSVPSFYPARDEDKFVLLRESSAPLTSDEEALIRGAVHESESSPEDWRSGFILEHVPRERALEVMERLEPAGVPLLLMPERTLISLPSPREHSEIEVSLEGVRFGERIAPIFVPWKNCLFAAGVCSPLGDIKSKKAGLLDVEIEDVIGVSGDGVESTGGAAIEYEESKAKVPFLEIIASEPLARHRWRVPAEIDYEEEIWKRFFDVAQELSLSAGSTPMNEGLITAFERALPDACVFPAQGRMTRYMSWQLQLARLKREKTYV